MPLPETPPEWKETLGAYLAKQLPAFAITVREAAAIVGVGDPNHAQLNMLSDLLKTLGWGPHEIRRPGGGRTRIYLRGNDA